MSGRSWLFVPGSRPERFDKALASGADEVILDLEDAVDPGAKDAARESVVAWLANGGTAWVRTNAVGTPWWAADIAALTAVAGGLRGVVLPKAEARAIAVAAEATPRSLPIVALVETARGVREAGVFAGHPQVTAIAFGSVDYALDLEATDPGVLDHARHELVLAARAAGGVDLIDGVTLEVTNPDAVRRDARRARSLGFGGKLCIHPSQVDAVHEALSPTSDEVAWATRVLETAAALPPEQASAFRVDGRLVDRPVLRRAHHLLELSGVQS